MLRERAAARDETRYKREGAGVLVAADSAAQRAALAVQIQRARQLARLLADHGQICRRNKGLGVAVAENSPSLRGALLVQTAEYQGAFNRELVSSWPSALFRELHPIVAVEYVGERISERVH